LKSGGIALGTWITINHPDVVDALSTLPFDWFVFDMEHAPLTVSDLEVLLMPLRGSSIAPLVRVPWNDIVVIKRVLDLGAEGILIPWVNSGEEAEAAVKYASYPPRGVRGAGPRRCIRFGGRDFLDYYGKFEVEERTIIVQIETSKALRNLEEILSTAGIDAAFIGPMDLSLSLGVPTQYDHPKFVDAVERVLRACQRFDVAPGIHAFNTEMAKKAVAEGFRFVALMSDIGIMRRGFANVLSGLGRAFREAAEGY